MRRFVEGADRGQSTLFPECLDDWIDEDNPVRVIDVFVDELDLGALEPSARLDPVQIAVNIELQEDRRMIRGSPCRLRNNPAKIVAPGLALVEVMWLTGRLVPN